VARIHSFASSTLRRWVKSRAEKEAITADIRDIAAIEKAMDGIDCVVHLAGASVESPWDKVLPLNVEGCYNTFEAARRQGVKRVIFASSNHAVGFHRRERFMDNTVVPRPDTRYGVSKVFGEAVGRLDADKYGLSVACLRIGTFRTPDRPIEARQLLTWISRRTWSNWRAAASIIRTITSSLSTEYPTTFAAAGTTATSSFSATVQRMTLKYSRQRFCQRAPRRTKLRRNFTAASTVRWNSPAIRR
jgi:nucleoside-diphosphate-sugar epimerase